VDRREISRRIAQIKEDLEQVRRHRALHRRQRKRQAVPVVAIVGYTNAGKSTLLNALSGADVLVEDKLFATLDPTTRRVTMPSGREVLFSDTVGFIQKLPTDLVAAFRATLEEIKEADLILHVVDITHDNVYEQSETVMDTLADLEVIDRPLLVALNKIDRLPDPAIVQEWLQEFPNSLAISAALHIGLEELRERVEEVLSTGMVYLQIRIPYDRGDLAAFFHERATMVKTAHGAEGTVLEGYLPRQWLEQFRPYLI
jgi:GTP-binding protein HflX